MGDGRDSGLKGPKFRCHHVRAVRLWGEARVTEEPGLPTVHHVLQRATPEDAWGPSVGHSALMMWPLTSGSSLCRGSSSSTIQTHGSLHGPCAPSKQPGPLPAHLAPVHPRDPAPPGQGVDPTPSSSPWSAAPPLRFPTLPKEPTGPSVTLGPRLCSAWPTKGNPRWSKAPTAAGRETEVGLWGEGCVPPTYVAPWSPPFNPTRRKQPHAAMCVSAHGDTPGHDCLLEPLCRLPLRGCVRTQVPCSATHVCMPDHTVTDEGTH